MASEIDYQIVLADLENKRAAIDAAIAGVRQMLNLGTEASTSGGVTRPAERPDQVSLRFDSFFQMSLPAAIKKFLEMATVPQSVSDISRSLLEGGFKTTSKNLMPTVGSTLSRMKAAGELVNVDGKWGLASWYPAARKIDNSRAEPKAGASRHKLTAEQEQQVKLRAEAGGTYRELAKEFGVSRGYIWRIVSGRKLTAAAQNETTAEPAA